MSRIRAGELKNIKVWYKALTFSALYGIFSLQKHAVFVRRYVQSDDRASLCADRRTGVLCAEIAEKALEKGIKDVVFDRGGFIYQGKVQALADAAREAGLKF